MSLYLFYAGVAILLVGLLLPGWYTASLPKRAVKRRIYWAATAVAAHQRLVACARGGQNA